MNFSYLDLVLTFFSWKLFYCRIMSVGSGINDDERNGADEDENDKDDKK